MTNPETELPADLAAMRISYEALAELDPKARKRALHWLFDILDVDYHHRQPVFSLPPPCQIL